MEIITAIGDNKLNKILREEKYEVKEDDLKNQEDVLNVLEKNKKIKIIFLYQLLPGELNIFDFINKILKTNKKIKIFIILEKENKELIKFLYSKKIYNIFYNKKIKTEKLIYLIKTEKEKNYKTKLNKLIKIFKQKARKYIVKYMKNKRIKNNKKTVCILRSTRNR